MKKSCGNCACIEHRLNSIVCVLNDRYITGIGICEKWEPSNKIELDMLRKENAELSGKAGQLEKALQTVLDRYHKLDSETVGIIKAALEER